MYSNQNENIINLQAINKLYKLNQNPQPICHSNNAMINESQNQGKQYTTKMHQKYIFMFQLLGTFLFTYSIGCSTDIMISHSRNFIQSTSLLLALALSGQISGGYFNSTITIAAFLNKRHKMLARYIIAQTLGGLLGVGWCYLLTGYVVKMYQRQEPLDLVKFVINEIVGSFFFSICFLTLTNKFTTHAYKSWQIYVSVAAAFYLTKKMTANTPINPTAALFYQVACSIYYGQKQYLIDAWVLIVPSTVGGILGGLFMHKVYEPLLLSIRYKNQQNNDPGQSRKFISEPIIKV